MKIYVETWEGFLASLKHVDEYLDELESRNEKLRLALDTETYLEKRARDRYDLIYSCGKLRKKEGKAWAQQVIERIDAGQEPEDILVDLEPPEGFRLQQDPKYPVPRPIKNRWGFFDARVRLVQIGFNPKHVNLQYVLDLDKIKVNFDKHGDLDTLEFYKILGDYFKPFLTRPTIIGQNLGYEYGFFWKYFHLRIREMRDTFLMSQIRHMGNKITHKLSALYKLYIEKDLFAELIEFQPEELRVPVKGLDPETGEWEEVLTDEIYDLLIIKDPFKWYDRFKEEEQTSPWHQWNLTDDQIRYAAEDVFLVWYVFETLLTILSEWATEHDTGKPGTGLMVIVKLECELIKAVSKAEVTGFPLDVDYYLNEFKPLMQKQIEDAQAEADLNYKKVYTKTKKHKEGKGKNAVITFTEETVVESYNLNSPDQVRQILGHDICKELPLTEKGKPTTGADELFIIQHRHPIIPLVLKVKKALKNIAFFEGRSGYLKHIDSDNVIHHKIWQIGTSEESIDSGRMSGSNPNLMNVPRDSRIRKAFKAPKGKKLIILDKSQIEPRIQAEIAEDKFLIDCFKNKRDLHAETAKHIFKLPYSPDNKKDPEQVEWRLKGKTMRLARTYLMGEAKGIKSVYVESDGKIDYFLKGEEGKLLFRRDLEEFDAMTPQVTALRQRVEKEVRALPERLGTMEPFKNGTPFYVGRSMVGRTRQCCLQPKDRADVAKHPEEWRLDHKVLYIKTGKISTWANKSNKVLRDIARALFNNLIQSSAADCFKQCIVAINQKIEDLEDQGIIPYNSCIQINFVHDEFIMLCLEEFADFMTEVIKKIVIDETSKYIKSVPIEVSGGPCLTWAEKD